jgi:transcriptional regulator with XRE-family HTH domain
MRYDLTLFGPHLREACKARGVTVAQVGHSIGLAPRRIVDLEQSGVHNLDVYRLADLAQSLNVSVDWLLGREES